MSRGESDKSAPRSPALGIWGLFGTLTLGVILLVVWSVRECGEPDTIPVAPTDPIERAREAFGELRYRDCRTELDARAGIEAELGQRGYQQSSPLGAPLELPIRVAPRELGGACGVVVFVAEATSRITSVGEVGRPTTTCQEDVTTFGVCGATEVEAQGVGQARVAVWVMPGLTRAALDATGIPHDLALAHAEAEILLASHGFTPSDQVVVIGLERGDPFDARALPRPRSGCVAWVIAEEGLGPFETTLISPGYMHGWRLAGTVTCHDGSTSTTFRDPQGDGGTFYAIPYSARGRSGPAVPSDEAIVSRIGSVRTVSPRAIELPAPLP